MAFQTLVRARGVAPANATVERMSPTECVMRCVLLFDVDAPIEFDARLPGRPPFAVQGKIRSCVRVPPRFEYTVALHPAAPPAQDKPEEASLRAQPRTSVEFPLRYRTAKQGFTSAKAGNVSAGGLLMTCREELVEGMVLELHFVLPSDVLAVYPATQSIIDVRSGFRRRRVPSKLRKPFEDLVVPARVVHRRPLGNGVYAYGVNFFGLDRQSRGEIERFVEAVHRVKLRKIP